MRINEARMLGVQGVDAVWVGSAMRNETMFVDNLFLFDVRGFGIAV